ncbi:hypothetical protein DSO57_1002985 [Entomophthora muscae]|uniref:Uncharacterized protein n=1 Tax=Entomophthora muscae TaxID=34485 RepID=A0ACC2U702_9FUNG|nr:hypothetical protein DSO57_1002985 [Entomophthora muscae]
MKSILVLAAVYFASVEPTLSSNGICNSDIKEITLVDELRTEASSEKELSFDIDTIKAQCKEKTAVKVFAGVTANATIELINRFGPFLARNGTVAIDIKANYIPKYDGINFYISEFEYKHDITSLLRGWKTQRQLSLTMLGTKWPGFRKELEKDPQLFSRFYLKFENIAAFKKISNQKLFTKKPKTRVYFLFDKETANDFKEIRKAAKWVKGVSYTRRFKGEVLLGTKSDQYPF